MVRYALLDLLRFVAALSVVLYHYTARDLSHIFSEETPFSNFATISKYGYLGVDLFFMISGFVIILSIENRKPIEFVISRFSRLYPSYWVAITFTFAIVTLLPDQSGRITLKQYLANFLMFHPDLGFRNIDGIYWTLQVELQFYFLVWLLMLSRLIKHYHLWLSVWLICTASYLLAEQPFFMGWVINPFWSSYFIAGVSFYLIKTRGISAYPVFMILTCLALSIIYAFKGVSAFIPDAGTTEGMVAGLLVLFLYVLFFAFSVGLLSLKPAPWVTLLGGLTYPLYLFHNRAGRVIFDSWAPMLGPFITLILLVSLMVAVSFVVYHLVEKRLARAVRRSLRLLLIRS